MSELIVHGARPLRGEVRLPGDKSISHRALLFAAMAQGESRLRNLGAGADVRSTMTVLRALGVAIEAHGDEVVVSGRGLDGFGEPHEVLDTGNSGTTTRLLLGLLAGRPFHAVLSGDESLNQRPMRRVVAPLRTLGARIDGRDDGEHLPLAIRGGALRAQRVDLQVASAQVKSALILAGLQADGITQIRELLATRDHTERMLQALGAPVRVEGDAIVVERGAPEPFDLDVPGDPSSAAFFVAAACVAPQSEVACVDVACNPGRIAFVDVLQRMGGDVSVEITGARCGEPVGTIRARTSQLHGTEVHGAEVPALIDEIPILALTAAFADGVTEFRDAAELRVKESDRVATVAAALSAFGVGTEPRPDGLSVRGGAPRPGRVQSAGDHRIAMAAASVAGAMEGETVIEGADAAAVSYPGFAADFERLAEGAS
ncbi:MAG: 3-phosphoshikimate 1-carboxyvinyltransferase [Acidimicrobiia bacterium]